ncbi:MAG: flagellar biosynthesis protein FlhA [Candidatus Eremiobacteraeota bacterium]|nr:flagellar biosynthesis protein FlhA [Candidatus Eremiobacteraeota bacterium]MCW5871979.1 flagellar biosynthesis protein FlhA [Candidatus Eremiobacteraeota bacterium]
MKLLKMSDVMVAFLVLGIIMMLIIPLPPWFLDILLVLNIAGSIITILISITISEPLQFAVFPTLLLVATLFRLALDVSATRMILLHGYIKDPVTKAPIGAGHLIPAFGNVVVGGNLIVGFIMFIILILIQIMVITNGAERIAQVAARFTLDAMPGKQMAIDADLHSGLLDAEQAKLKRRNIEREADFYGSMDGAGKFVKGDAMAAIVIMVVNVVGGILIGILYHKMSAVDALNTFAILSIGNGLITTLPAFLMSTAMGMVVSRAASDSNLGSDMAQQITAQPEALKMAAGAMFGLGGLGVAGLFAFPPLPFFILGGIMFYAQHVLTSKTEVVQEVAEVQAQEQKKAEAKKPESVVQLMQVDPISLEVGRGLLGLVDPNQGAKLLERVTSIRRHIALEMGIVVPGVRFRDNLQLKPNAYVIKIKDIEVAQGEVQVNQFLAIGPEEKLKNLRGTKTVDPTYGMPGVWISPEQRGDAERLGCMIFDPVSVVATQLTEVVRAHANDLLGRQEVQALIDTIKKTHPAVVKEVIPDALSLGEVQKVLQNLVKERVSIRDLVSILETMADNVHMTKDPEMLTEFVRVSLSRTICKEYMNNEGTINVITLDPQIEQTIQQSIHRSETGSFLNLDPNVGQEILQAIAAQVQTLQERGLQPVLLTSPPVRPALRKLVERSFPNLVLLSWNEIAPKVNVNSVAMVTM